MNESILEALKEMLYCFKNNNAVMIQEEKDAIKQAEEAIKKWEDSSGKETGMPVDLYLKELMEWIEKESEKYGKEYDYPVTVANHFYDGAIALYGHLKPLLDESVPPYKEEETGVKWVKEQADQYAFNLPASLDSGNKGSAYSGFISGANAMKVRLESVPPYKEEETGLDGIAGVPNKEGTLEYDNAIDLLRDIDKSLYIGEDLAEEDILKWYIDVVTVIKDSIKAFLDPYKEGKGGFPTHDELIETFGKPYKEEVDKEWKWTDDLVKKYAEIYRFSSSRTSIEQFKKNPDWIVQEAANKNYETALLESKEEVDKDH